jgi:hypothetical protein
MGAAAQDANRLAIVFGYGKSSKLDSIKEGIKSMTNKRPWKVRVEGHTADGRFEVINLVSNKEAFGSVDLEKASEGLDIDLLNPAAMLHGSPMMKLLLEKAATPRVSKMLNPSLYVPQSSSTST